MASLRAGRRVDRVPCMPFMEELKCLNNKVTPLKYSRDSLIMADTEICNFERFGYDRVVIGPNSRGISEALGAEFIYPDAGVPYPAEQTIKNPEYADAPANAEDADLSVIKVFDEAAAILAPRLNGIVPLEMSIGGPFTIASFLRGTEELLRDCRRKGREIHALLRVICDLQKKCIDIAAGYGAGIAMADPVASPELIGPGMYRDFVMPYTQELTEYAKEVTGKGVSLHMCGKTYAIWKYLIQYPIGELSIDNVIDLRRAAAELGNHVHIAGNVDPVNVVMNGSRDEIRAEVHRCIEEGKRFEKGFTLATGCDIPESTDPVKVEWFMDAAREFSCSSGKEMNAEL